MNSTRSLLQVQLASQLTYTLLITAVRMSILLLYRRIFFLRNRYFAVAWWSSIAIVLGYCIALLVIPLTQCSPHSVDNLWRHPEKCRQGPRNTRVGAKAPAIWGFVNIFVDLCLLILPIKMIWNLKLTIRRKILVYGLFCLGMLGVAVSIARAIALLDLDADPVSSSSGVELACWSSAEAAVALLCACLPMQRSLFGHVYERLTSTRGTQKSSSLY